ncbi:MAG: hypothetical protein ACQXXC_08680 [Methanolinea tarda]|nr:hypothetical protein [Methanolinea sp.]
MGLIPQGGYDQLSKKYDAELINELSKKYEEEHRPDLNSVIKRNHEDSYSDLGDSLIKATIIY